MANEAARNRKALIDHVQDCIRQVNAVTVDLGTLRTAQAALVDQARTDVTMLDVRVNALKAEQQRLQQRLALIGARVDAGVVFLHAAEHLRWQDRLRWLCTGRLPMRYALTPTRVAPPQNSPAVPVSASPLSRTTRSLPV